MSPGLDKGKDMMRTETQLRLMALLPDGWTLRLTPGKDGYCWRDRMQIDIGKECDSDEAFRLMLHELAHIPECPYCNDGHCSHWYDRLVVFHEIYGCELTESEKLIARSRKWSDVS